MFTALVLSFLMTNARPEERKTWSSTLSRNKIGYSKESNDQRHQKRIHFTLSNRCEEDAKTNLLLLLFPTRFAHARYSSPMIDRFLNSGDHGNPKTARSKAVASPPGLVITASWEDLAAVVFVSNRFMSSCVICLVIARQIFLRQSDCSAITKVHKFWAYFIINLFCKG